MAKGDLFFSHQGLIRKMERVRSSSIHGIFIKCAFELLLIVYTLISFKPFFSAIAISLDAGLIYGSLILCFGLIVLAVLRSRYYTPLVYFRLGIAVMLILYMLITNRICLKCVIYHVLVISGFIAFALFNYFKPTHYEKE